MNSINNAVSKSATGFLAKKANEYRENVGKGIRQNGLVPLVERLALKHQ